VSLQVEEPPYISFSSVPSGTLADVEVQKQKRMRQSDSPESMRGTGKAKPRTPLVVTNRNVEELKKKLDTLQE
jgi:hypothetical protein